MVNRPRLRSAICALLMIPATGCGFEGAGGVGKSLGRLQLQTVQSETPHGNMRAA